jgi:DNA-binding LytR/AlgR family response regulator
MAAKEKIAIPGEGKYECFFTDELAYFKGDVDITHIYILDPQGGRILRKLTSYKNLGYYVSLLPADDFIRVCKSTVINFNLLASVNDDHTLTLKGVDHEPITLSPVFSDALELKLKK